MNWFIDTLTRLRSGKAAAEWENDVRQVIDAVRATGRKGKVTITLELSMLSPDDEHSIRIKDVTKLDVPTSGGGDSVMYAGQDGALTTRDPRQPAVPEGLGIVDRKTFSNNALS